MICTVIWIQKFQYDTNDFETDLILFINPSARAGYGKGQFLSRV